MPGLFESDQDGPGSPSICIIGAGFSGMCAGIRLEKDLNLTNFQIFEMNKGVGGTWHSNSYPGAACDIPIHGYTFGFEKTANWRAQYASQTEILDYLKGVADKYDLNRRIRFSHKIKRMSWDKELCQWRVDIEDLETGRLFERTFDIVVNATGSLRVPKVPQEFKEFKGQILHTAMWDDSISLENKKVGVIGTGSSGIQVIPEVAKVAKKLIVYQRTPSWIIPRVDFEFSPIFKWFLNLPGFLALYRLILFFILECFWLAMSKGSLLAKILTALCNRFRRSQLKGDTVLYDKLTPKYKLGCRRTAIASSFYPTFLKPNTSLVTSSIEKVTPNSIITSEGEEKIDVLVLATGFKVSDYFSPMEMYDRNGDNVLLKWKKEGPSLFLGILGNDLPNLFILYGPNTNTGHTSVVITVEMQMDFVVKCLGEMLQQKSRVLTVRKSTEVKYMTDILEQFKTMVWSASSCSPWYADERGVIIALYPGSLVSYQRRINSFNVNKNLEFQ